MQKVKYCILKRIIPSFSYYFVTKFSFVFECMDVKSKHSFVSFLGRCMTVSSFLVIASAFLFVALSGSLVHNNSSPIRTAHSLCKSSSQPYNIQPLPNPLYMHVFVDGKNFTAVNIRSKVFSFNRNHAKAN